MFSLAVLHSLLHLPLTENNFHYYELLLFCTPPRGYYSSNYPRLKSCSVSLIYIISIPLQNPPEADSPKARTDAGAMGQHRAGACGRRELSTELLPPRLHFGYALRPDSDATATHHPTYSLLGAYKSFHGENFHFLRYKSCGSGCLQGRWDTCWDLPSWAGKVCVLTSVEELCCRFRGMAFGSGGRAFWLRRWLPCRTGCSRRTLPVRLRGLG